MPDQTPTIRRATPADAALLTRFAARTFADTFGALNRPEDMEEHERHAYNEARQRAELEDPAVVSLFSEIGGEVAGFAQVRRVEPPSCVDRPRPVELWRFYVDAPFHGRGIAQLQMRAVEEAARELGGQTLWLGVWEKNTRAIAFYLKCGFVDVGEQDYWLGSDRQTDRVMVRSLGGGGAAGGAG
jgi:ribosomal protein S18 acetylase RimI-like enzyme